MGVTGLPASRARQPAVSHKINCRLILSFSAQFFCVLGLFLCLLAFLFGCHQMSERAPCATASFDRQAFLKTGAVGIFKLRNEVTSMHTTQIQSFNPQETICSKVNVRPAAKATDIDKLANDIKHHGQLQPVIIRFEDGKPAVIAGQRRRKALRKLCRKDPSLTLDGLVVHVDDMEATAISLSENKNQLPMSALDSYKALSKLAKLGWDAQSISQVYSIRLKVVSQ